MQPDQHSMNPRRVETAERIVKESDLRQWVKQVRVENLPKGEDSQFETKARVTRISIPHPAGVLQLVHGVIVEQQHPDPHTNAALRMFNLFDQSILSGRDSDLYAVFFDNGSTRLDGPPAKQLFQLALSELKQVEGLAQEFLGELGSNPERVRDIEWQPQISEDERVTVFSGKLDGFDITCRRIDKPEMLGKRLSSFEASVTLGGDLVGPIKVDGPKAQKIFEAVEQHRR